MIKVFNMGVLKALKSMPDESVDCVVTSPPYWGLRDYQIEDSIFGGDSNCEHEWIDKKFEKERDLSYSERLAKEAGHNTKLAGQNSTCSKCGAWKGQLGLEPTFQLYIYHLCNIFDEVKRVLKKTGTCFVNLGDTYYSVSGGKFENDKIGSHDRNELKGLRTGNELKSGDELTQKNLCNIPNRFSIEMQNRGWILRNELIWYKRNCMPSSVRDRFTVDFEKIFFFVKDRKYYFEKILVPLADTSKADNRKDKGTVVNKSGKTSVNNQHAMKGTCINSVGRNMRCVWDITTKGFKEAHFAVFPEELPRRCIKAGCPEFVCNRCGKPREKIINHKVSKMGVDLPISNMKIDKDNPFIGGNLSKNSILRIKGGDNYGKWKEKNPDEFLGYSDCNCGEGFSKGVVLDLFVGSGTSLKVARELNRNSIGIEINPNYIEIIKKRLFNGNSPVLTDFEIIKDEPPKSLNT